MEINVDNIVRVHDGRVGTVIDVRKSFLRVRFDYPIKGRSYVEGFNLPLVRCEDMRIKKR